MAPPRALLLLLLGLRSSAGSLPPPRTSFLLNSTDRPLVFFSLPDVHNTTTLLLSDDESTLYVGARDALLSLDVSRSDVIRLKKKVDWSPSEAETSACAFKVTDPSVNCPNFVSVLQPINSSHLYACGSSAFNPHDAFIDTDTFSLVQHGGAKGRCPFSPFQRSSALAADGELFTATTTSFRGAEPQISRHFSKDGRPDVSQDVTLLEDPAFVSSWLDASDRKLYFFFTEVGKEFSFVEDLRVARVAQVCRDDVGGQRILQRKWTSFAKAPLLCQAPKQLPFNVLQDVFTLRPPGGSNTSDTLFYGVFTSQWSSGPESAVCVFKLQDVRTVFSEGFRTFDTQKNRWTPTPGKHLGKCGLDRASDSELAEAKKTFLTSNSVRPEGGGPVLVSPGQRYGRVAVMRTRALDGTQHTVLFLLTETGLLHKVVLFDGGARVIEEIQVFTEPQLVRSIILSSSKGVLYVGTSEGVTAVPVARCSIYRTCSQCVLARDPLCGWSRTRGVCSGLGGASDDMAQDLEDADVEEACRGQTETRRDEEVLVDLNAAVRLQCRKPSSRAALTWTSSRFQHLPENLFIQSAEGTLIFLATAATFGMYRCEAEEGNYREVVAAYAVRQTASPRSMSPEPEDDGQQDPNEPFADIMTETPLTSDETKNTEADSFTVDLKDETVSSRGDPASRDYLQDEVLDWSQTPRQDVQFGKEPLEDLPEEKSYYGELVGVSLLLAACVGALILTGLHAWLRRRPGPNGNPLVSPEDGSRTSQSMESVPSLSSPDGLDLKVVE